MFPYADPGSFLSPWPCAGCRPAQQGLAGLRSRRPFGSHDLSRMAAREGLVCARRAGACGGGLRECIAGVIPGQHRHPAEYRHGSAAAEELEEAEGRALPQPQPGPGRGSGERSRQEAVKRQPRGSGRQWKGCERTRKGNGRTMKGSQEAAKRQRRGSGKEKQPPLSPGVAAA